jgi:hypothetical protein
LTNDANALRLHRVGGGFSIDMVFRDERWTDPARTTDGATATTTAMADWKSQRRKWSASAQTEPAFSGSLRAQI